MLDHGADPNLYGEGGCSPMASVAAEETFTAVPALLVSRGAIITTDELRAAIGVGHDSDYAMVRFLIANGVDVNRRLTHVRPLPPKPWGPGQTPLHLAAKAGSPTVVRLLLDAGADPTALWVDHRPSEIAQRNMEEWPPYKEVYDMLLAAEAEWDTARATVAHEEA